MLSSRGSRLRWQERAGRTEWCTPSQHSKLSLSAPLGLLACEMVLPTSLSPLWKVLTDKPRPETH